MDRVKELRILTESELPEGIEPCKVLIEKRRLHYAVFFYLQNG